MLIFRFLFPKSISSKTHVTNVQIRFEKAKLSREMRLTFSFHVLRDGPTQITGNLFRDDFRGKGCHGMERSEFSNMAVFLYKTVCLNIRIATGSAPPLPRDSH